MESSTGCGAGGMAVNKVQAEKYGRNEKTVGKLKKKHGRMQQNYLAEYFRAGRHLAEKGIAACMPASSMEEKQMMSVWGRSEAKGNHRNETIRGLIGVVAFEMESQRYVFSYIREKNW